MTPMMNTTADLFAPLFVIVHILSMLAFGFGIVFLAVWAIKTLTHKQLKTWGIALTVIGVILCIICCIGMGFGHPRIALKYDVMKSGGMHMMGNGMMMKNDDMMMNDYMMMNTSDDAMNMSMNDMAGMLEGKTGDDFDKAFLEGMIPHHEGAIDMAEAALRDAKHAEIRDMANAIITTQQREIDQMKQWMRSWGYAK